MADSFGDDDDGGPLSSAQFISEPTGGSEKWD